MIILCNPHNPSGRIWSRNEINKILEICVKHNLFLLSDEILSDLIPESHLRNFYSLVNEAYPKIVVGK